MFSVQCSVSSVQCPGITGMSSVQYTYILLLRTVRQHFLLEAAGKVQIVYKALFAKLQRSPTLPLSHHLSLSFSLFQCGIRCFVEILTAVTSMLDIQADRVHPYRHARKESQRAGAGERKRWLDILSGIQRPLSCVSVCMLARVCGMAEGQLHFVGSSLISFQALCIYF